MSSEGHAEKMTEGSNSKVSRHDHNQSRGQLTKQEDLDKGTNTNSDEVGSFFFPTGQKRANAILSRNGVEKKKGLPVVENTGMRALRGVPEKSGGARRTPGRSSSMQARRAPDRSSSGRAGSRVQRSGSNIIRRKVPERSSSNCSMKAFRKERMENTERKDPFGSCKGGGDCDSIQSDLDSTYTMDSINLRKSQMQNGSPIDDASACTMESESIVSFTDSILLRRFQMQSLHDENDTFCSGDYSSLNSGDQENVQAEFENLEDNIVDGDLCQEGVFTIRES